MKKILLSTAIIALITALIILTLNKLNSGSASVDERYIDDSSSIGMGVKLKMVDGVSGMRVRNTDIQIISLISAEDTEVFDQGQTDKNGVFFLDLTKWNQHTPLTIKLKGYFPVIGKFSNTNNQPKNGDSLLLEVEPDNLTNMKVYKVIDDSGNEFKNISLDININTCTDKHCDDLTNTSVQVNNLGNVYIPTKYLVLGVTFEIDGYKPVVVDGGLRNQSDQVIFYKK